MFNKRNQITTVNSVAKHAIEFSNPVVVNESAN